MPSASLKTIPLHLHDQKPKLRKKKEKKKRPQCVLLELRRRVNPCGESLTRKAKPGKQGEKAVLLLGMMLVNLYCPSALEEGVRVEEAVAAPAARVPQGPGSQSRSSWSRCTSRAIHHTLMALERTTAAVIRNCVSGVECVIPPLLMRNNWCVVVSLSTRGNAVGFDGKTEQAQCVSRRICTC